MALRTEKEIQEYLEEAFDKVWLMRSRPCGNEEIEERRKENVKRILDKYDDIPSDYPYEWDYGDVGYWNGILGALRWVLGEEKDFLDT